MNVYKQAFRFYGFQKLLFTIAALPVVVIAAYILAGSPPEDWDGWPRGAQYSVTKLTAGLYLLALLWWFWTLLRSCVRSVIIRRVLVCLIGAITVFIFGWAGAWEILGGFVGLTVNDGSHTWRALMLIARMAVLPLLLGAVVLYWPDLKARVKAHRTLRRWFVSGTGPHSGWAGPMAIRKLVRPLSRHSKGGLFTRSVFIGRTNFEDTFSSGEELCLDGPSHICTIAQTGGGKHICAAPNYAMYQGSMIHCTVKPEAADQFLGARVDQELLDHHATKPSAGRKGVDPRGITKASRWVPKSRAYLLDAAGQSVYPSNRHTLLSEINVEAANARVLSLAISDGSFPERKSSSDPWFREAPRNFLAADILHSLTQRDQRWASLPRIVERGMGIDRINGQSGPQVMKQLLIEMANNRHPNVGGFIQTTAAQILELGDRGYGTLKSEFQTNCAWCLDPFMERQLVGTSDFSYRELGDDANPVTVFLVPPRGDAALRSALPWLRAHAELSLQILQTNSRRPKTATLFVADEARQYLQGISAIKSGLTLLRDAQVKLWIFFQSWPSALETLGKDAAAELEACSTMQYFAINDMETATRISQRLGYTTLKQRDMASGKVEQKVAQVISPDEVLRELSLTSQLSYVMGGGVVPMRVRRVAYKPIVTREGGRFEGLPLAGQYDEGLSRFTYGN